MLFPKSAQEAISKAFYDKTVEVFSFETQLGLEGDVSKVFQRRGEFAGNVRFTNLAKLQQEIGLTDEINIAITCSKEEEINAGDFVKFEKRMYRIEKLLPFDSHLLIVGIVENENLG